MQTNNSLALIVDEMHAIVSKIVEAGGELTPELETMFAEVGNELQTKVDSYAFIMDKLDTEADFWKARAESYSKVAKSCSALKSRLNDSIKMAMIQLDTKEIEGSDMRFKLSSSAPKMVIDETKIEDAYKKTTVVVEPDKERIKEDLTRGVPVEGAKLEPVFSLRKYVNKKGA